MVARTFNILLVEDNSGDVVLIREILKESSLNINLHVARDGVEALAFLRKKEPHYNARCPDLILLDLNLPRKDGREVLGEIKTDEGLSSIPVVVLTTSHAEHDIERCYNFGANCYVCKPLDFEQLNVVVKVIETFWLTTARLPSCL